MTNKELVFRVNQLIKQVAERDETALAELYNATYQKIFRCLQKHCHDYNLIEESINDAFGVVMDKSAENTNPNGLRWITRISYNQLRNKIRKVSRVDLIDENYQIEMADNTDLDSALDFKDFMDKLPSVERSILHLKVYCGEHFGSISTKLNLSVSTVKRLYKEIKTKVEERYGTQRFN